MAFQFGFSNDDDDDGIDTTEETAAPSISQQAQDEHENSSTQHHQVPVQEHDLNALLSTLPSHISYSPLALSSPSNSTITLPRRNMYDVRVQLLQEGPVNDEVIDQIDASDLRSGVYEGGFKTWECSLDLASLVLERGPRRGLDELEEVGVVVELGAGTALPSLVLFRHAIMDHVPLTMVLADYNDTVLRLVTLPNLLLTWAVSTSREEISSESDQDGELEISPALLSAFTSDLQSKQIELKFISGPWSDELASLIPETSPDLGLLILASETIYSPASTEAFVHLLVLLLKRVKMAKAMVAAKRMYFGVGGSVDGLKTACAARGAIAYEIENHGVPGMDRAGVERALVEVQMA